MTTGTTTIATTTLQQLGGSGRLKAMIGARDFVSSGDNNETLQFKFKGCRKTNFVKVTLDPISDLYRVEFFRIVQSKKSPVPTVVSKGWFAGLYNDQLKAKFEDFTKLYLSL